jgi:L-lactate dehydrogenase
MTVNYVRKVVLVGAGMVGMSYAYAMLNQNACDELVLVDMDHARAEGEAMDLNHGLAFASGHMRITAGDYAECRDAHIVAICAGAAQKPGETRLQLLERNAAVFRSIIEPVIQSGFNGIFLIATNPVDIMSYIAYKLSGFNPRQVVGTGTTLDTARLHYLLGKRYQIDPRNIHAYVIGEHGDSEFVPWSQAMIATKPIGVIRTADGHTYEIDHNQIETDVRTAAEQIIRAKRATYYGIGMAMTRITKAVLSDENSVLTVSSLLKGEYGESGVYIGAPCIVNRNGIKQVLELDLIPEEHSKFHASCDILRNLLAGLHLGSNRSLS